jgi:hypothetical protein
MLSDLFGLGSFAYTAGIFTILAIDYIFRDQKVAWMYCGTAVVLMVAAVVIGRRTLLKIPEK